MYLQMVLQIWTTQLQLSCFACLVTMGEIKNEVPFRSMIFISGKLMRGISVRILLIVLLPLLFAACSTYHAVLVNQENQELICHSEGVGIIIPHIQAHDTFDKCVKDAQMKGYKIKTQE